MIMEKKENFIDNFQKEIAGKITGLILIRVFFDLLLFLIKFCNCI